MSIEHETGRRPGGRLRMDAAQSMIAAALGIMFLALLLAAAAVQGATIPVQMPQAALAPSAGPSLIVQGEDGALTALEPSAAKVTARVDALAARVAVEHRFRAGPSAARSGVYILPLPEDAEPRRVTLAVGDRKAEIGLAVEPGEPRPELLVLPISAIGAHAEVAIELVYERQVALGAGRFVLALPLAQGATPAPELSDAAWSGGRAPLALDLDPGLPIAELRSPSHGIHIQRGPGQRRRILLADPDPAMGRDFILVWKPADPNASIAALRRFTAAIRSDESRPDDGMLLRPRALGSSIALAPAAASSAPLAGFPADDGAILTAIAARGGLTPSSPAASVSPAIAASILVLWAVGALYLATRRDARAGLPATSTTGTLQ
jgi:hypothetical protein